MSTHTGGLLWRLNKRIHPEGLSWWLAHITSEERNRQATFKEAKPSRAAVGKVRGDLGGSGGQAWSGVRVEASGMLGMFCFLI